MNRKVTPLNKGFQTNLKGMLLFPQGHQYIQDFRITFINTDYSVSSVKFILPEPVPVCDKRRPRKSSQSS